MDQHAAVFVELEVGKGGYRVNYKVTSPSKKRGAIRSFIYNVSSASKEKRELIDANLIKNVMVKILKEKTDGLIWRKKPHEIRMEVVHYINRIMRSSKRGRHLQELGFGFKSDKGGKTMPVNQKQQNQQPEQEQDPKRFQDQELPKKSIFAAEPDTANTKVFLAPSFSGKTTLMVDELNKLNRRELEEYDKIVLFTESTSAAPLKKLDKKVREKMMIYDRFVPQFVRLLKKINTVTKNRYRFLLLMDDCLNLKGDILIKLILTLRNANISTVISIQYSKLLSRSQRQSIHDYYIINLHLEDLEYLMSGFLASHFRVLFESEGLAPREEINKWNYKKLAEKAMERVKGKILHFDQRHDEINIYERPRK
jgi:hypothetical protein